MISLIALLSSLPLIVPIGPISTISVDCDRDGVAEALHYQSDTISIGQGNPVKMPFAPDRIDVSTMANRDETLCRIDLIKRGRQSEALLFRKQKDAWQLWMRLPAGESSDGERRIELGFDSAGLHRYETTPDSTRCDGERRLFAAHYDVATERWLPEALPFPLGNPLQPIVPPGLPRSRSAYRITAISSLLGIDEGADRLAPPPELSDEDRRTTWAFTSPRGLAWLVARRTAGQKPLVGIEIDLLSFERPRRVALLLDNAPPQVVLLPQKGSTFHLPVPPDVKPQCISLVFDAGEEAGAALRALQVAGVRLLDGGASSVAGQLEEYGRGELSMVSAMRLSAQPEFADALRQRLLAAVQNDERRRLVELVARAGLSLPIALRCDLWRRANDTERPLLAAALHNDSSAFSCLVETLADRTQPDSTLSAAASLLAAHPNKQAVLALLARFSTAPAIASTLAATLRVILQKDSQLQLALLDPPVANASLPLVHYVLRDLTTLATPLALRLATDLTQIDQLPFDSAFLLLDAVAAHPRPEFVAALSNLVARNDLDPALLWRATRALGDYHDEEVIVLLQRLSTSTQLRVRLSALDGLVKQRRLASGTAVKMLDDRWPAAQAHAARILGSLCPNEPTLRNPIASHLFAGATLQVQQELLESYVKCPGDPIPLLSQLLADPKQAPELAARAVVLATLRATTETPDKLARVLLTILNDPLADDRQAELLLALVSALGRLSTTSRDIDKALLLAVQEPSMPMLRGAAFEAIAAICSHEGPAVLQGGLADPQPEVAAAARRGLAICPR